MKHQRITNKNWKNSATKYEACKDCLLDCEAGCPVNDEAYNRLAELEDKIKNGTLIELPRKVGKKVYHIYNVGIGKYIIDEETVSGYELETDILLGVVLRIRLNASTPSVAVIGDRVFFTREEAEKKLKELKGEK